MTFSDRQLIGIGVVAVVGLWYLSGKAKDAVQAVNPANKDNVVNSWFNDAYRSVTGSDETLGKDLADWNQDMTAKYYDYTPLGIYDNIAEWWDQRFSEVDG